MQDDSRPSGFGFSFPLAGFRHLPDGPVVIKPVTDSDEAEGSDE